MTQKTILERADEAAKLLQSIYDEMKSGDKYLCYIEDALPAVDDFVLHWKTAQQAEADQHEEYLKSLKSTNTFEGTYGEYRG